MAQVNITGLVKRFGSSFHAVKDVNITIEDGEFVFLLGPSGCGKTTTLRMVAGLEMPTEGKIQIGERDVTFLRPRFRNVGMVFQDYGLYRHMTVFGNIAYPLQVRGLSKSEIESKVNAVAETLKISEVLARKPDALSGGQLQRVAIARMLVRDANVFLMDEPMSHLDAQLRTHMRAELKHLQKSIGTTTIFVTHDQLEAMSMADRIIVMKDGVVRQFGTPQEIFERPADDFVAGFVGEPQMNFFDCTISRRGDGVFAVADGLAVKLDEPWLLANGVAVSGDAAYKLGVRPEHISIWQERDGAFSMPGEIYAFEATGAENLFTVKCGEHLMTARAPTNETVDLDTTSGAPVFIRADPSRIYLFDPKSGATVAQAKAANPEVN